MSHDSCVISDSCYIHSVLSIVTKFFITTNSSVLLLLLLSLLSGRDLAALGNITKPRCLAYCTSSMQHPPGLLFIVLILISIPLSLSYSSHHSFVSIISKKQSTVSLPHTVNLADGFAVEGEEPAVKKKVVYGKKKPQPKPKPAETDAQLASASSGAAAAAETQAAAEAGIATAQAQAEEAKAQAQQAEEAQKQQEAEVHASALPCVV
jgi:hypothetical protein